MIVTPGSNFCEKIQTSGLMLSRDATPKALEWSGCTSWGKEARISIICDQRENSGGVKMTEPSLKLFPSRGGACCLLP